MPCRRAVGMEARACACRQQHCAMLGSLRMSDYPSLGETEGPQLSHSLSYKREMKLGVAAGPGSPLPPTLPLIIHTLPAASCTVAA